MCPVFVGVHQSVKGDEDISKQFGVKMSTMIRKFTGGKHSLQFSTSELWLRFNTKLL